MAHRPKFWFHDPRANGLHAVAIVAPRRQSEVLYKDRGREPTILHKEDIRIM